MDSMAGAVGVFLFMMLIVGGIFWYQEWNFPSMGTVLIFVVGAVFGAMAMYGSIDVENEAQKKELTEQLAQIEKAQRDVGNRRENIDAEIDELSQD